MQDFTKKYPGPELKPCKDPDDYYANKDRARSYWADHLALAERAGAPADEMAFLRRRYEDACEVGD